MKIVVDKMPIIPSECPYAFLKSGGSEEDDDWISCHNGVYACEDTSRCPYFIGYDDITKDKLYFNLL